LCNIFTPEGSIRSVASSGIPPIADRRLAVRWRGGSATTEVVPTSDAPPPPSLDIVVPTPATPVVRKEPIVYLSLQTTVLVGTFFALNSGYLNGLGLLGKLGKTQAIAAVTGAYTTSGLQWAQGNPSWFLPIKIIVSYLLGSGITGYLNPFAQSMQLPILRVSSTLGVGTLLLLLAALFHSKDASSMNVYYFLTAANGLQNSLTSIYTGNMIRSTHYSGMTSDTGTFIGQVLQQNKKNVDRIIINSLLAISFWLGALVSYYISQTKAATMMLLLPSMLFYSGLAVTLLLRKPTDYKNA
jgi:uncharacterized membrane protein YoaK (UPF0700 family)